MRRSLRTLVPVVTAVTCAIVGLTAPLAAASPAPPAKNAPAAAPAPSPAPSSKFPTLPADKAVTGYQQVVSDQLTDPAGTQVSGSVTCPRGTKVMGGGAVIGGSALSENLNGSIPLSDGRTWRVYVNNASATDGTFRVYATCATRLASYSVVVGTGVDNQSGTQTTATVACPAGTVPLGGGGLGSSLDTAVNLNTSIPTATGWRVDVNNGSAGGDTATAYVTCGTAPNGYKLTRGTVTSNPANTQSSAGVGCRTGLTVLSGGVFSGSGSTAVNLNSSYPSGATGWGVYENNASASDTSFTAYALCAKSLA